MKSATAATRGHANVALGFHLSNNPSRRHIEAGEVAVAAAAMANLYATRTRRSGK